MHSCMCIAYVMCMFNLWHSLYVVVVHLLSFVTVAIAAFSVGKILHGGSSIGLLTLNLLLLSTGSSRENNCSCRFVINFVRVTSSSHSGL